MWRYRLPGYELRLLEELQRQKHNSLYCDTLLQTDGLSVPAHSCILAALSPYLSKALSTQSSPLPAGQRWPLKLQAVKAQTLLKLVDLLYSGELEGEGTMEQEEVMAAACKLGIGRLVEGWKDHRREGEDYEERRCSLRDVGVQTEAGERQVDVGALVETWTQTDDCNGGIYMTILSPLPDALPTSTHSPSPPNPPLLLVQSSSEGQQHTTHSAPPSLSPQIMTPTSHPSSTPPSFKATVNSGTSPFRTQARTSELEGYCTDVTNPLSSPVVLSGDVVALSDDSDHLKTPREKSAVPECSVAENGVTERRMEKKREQQLTPHTGRVEDGERRECLERRGVVGRKCLTGQRLENTQISIKVKLRRRTRGQVWELVSGQERDGTISPGPRQERDGTISPGPRQERDGTISPGQRQERDGTISPGQRQSVLPALKKETECMRTRQQPRQPLHPPQSPALPRCSHLDTALLTPLPDFPISPPRSHPQPTSNTTTKSTSLNHCSFTKHPTPHPVHEPELALPQPPVEESDEQIEKMLEDIMMGLNILPPMVLEGDCDRRHHLQSHNRPSACSCSHHPVHARHCGMHSTVGSALRCVCSHGYAIGRDDASSTKTATTCTVTPDLDPQPLTPHRCSTYQPYTPHHHSHPHPHFSSNDYSSDWAECNRASYCSGVLQFSSENAKNHQDLLIRFQNQNSHNQEVQNRSSKSLVFGCGGSSSSIIPVHSGPSPRPPHHHHQTLPQSQASLPYTGEEDRDPECWKGSSAQMGVPLTSKDHVCNLSDAECLSTNEDTTPSQVNGGITPSQSQASANKEVPQEEDRLAITPGFLPPSETDTSEPTHPACPPDATPGRGLRFPELLSLLSQGSETQPSQSPPPHWEELRLPKCLSPLNLQEPSPSPTKPFLKSPFRHPAPLHRIPQLSKLPPWLCRTPRILQFPLSSMIHSPRSPGNLCESKKCLLLQWESNNNSEQMTDGQDRATISNNARLAGEEERKRTKVTTGRRLEKPKVKRREGDETWKPHSNRKRIRGRRKEGLEPEQGRRLEKPKAKTERRLGDESWNPPRNRKIICVRRKEGLKAEQEQSEDSETTEPPRKKRKRNISTKMEVGEEDISPLVRTERLKLNDGTKTENGQVKISLCSVSLATNNVLANERLGRYLSTTSTKSLSSLCEEANGPPEGTKGLKRETGNPVRVLQARDREVKRPPVKGHQVEKQSNVSFETPSPSSFRFQALANAVGLLQIPPTPPPKRKRGRPRKIRPGKDQVSQAGGSVPSSAMTKAIHDSESAEHKKEKGGEPQRKEKGGGEPQRKKKGGEPQRKEKGGGEPQRKEKVGGEPQGKEKGGGEPQGKEKGGEPQRKEKGGGEPQGKDDKRRKYRKRVRLREGNGEGERAELFQRLPVLSKSKKVAQKSSSQTTSPSTTEEQVPSNCSGIGTRTIPEPQPSGRPQNSSPEKSGETESDRDQVSTPAVKLTPSKGRAPTVSLKKFQELLKHRHQKTRKSAKSKETTKQTGSKTGGVKQNEGKLLKPDESNSGQNESRLMDKNKSSSQSLERESAIRPTVGNYDQTNRTESDHPEGKDGGHNSSTCGPETKFQDIVYKDTERENVEVGEHFENADASGDFFELREELATLGLLSMTRTRKMVDPQRTDKGNKEGRDLLTKDNREMETDLSTESNEKTEEGKGSVVEAYRRSVIIREVEEKMEDGYLEMEISSEELDVVDEVHQTFGYAVTEEVSGEEEEIDVEEVHPTMYPDAAWQEVPGAREVYQASSTMASFRGITHNHIHLPQKIKMATAAPRMADVSLPTRLEAEPSTLTSSRRVTTGLTGSWEPEEEEEEEVEVDVLEWSPDVRPTVWGAGLEQGVTELTEEDVEEDEIDVMGEETD